MTDRVRQRVEPVEQLRHAGGERAQLGGFDAPEREVDRNHALGAAALATGLAAADGRADLTTLAAVGASPTLRRLLSLSQSGVIAGLGSLLGTAAGLATSVAVLTALNQRYAEQWPPPTPYPITVPWLNVAVALVLVPVVAMLGSALLTRSRLPIERRE